MYLFNIDCLSICLDFLLSDLVYMFLFTRRSIFLWGLCAFFHLSCSFYGPSILYTKYFLWHVSTKLISSQTAKKDISISLIIPSSVHGLILIYILHAFRVRKKLIEKWNVHPNEDLCRNMHSHVHVHLEFHTFPNFSDLQVLCNKPNVCMRMRVHVCDEWVFPTGSRWQPCRTTPSQGRPGGARRTVHISKSDRRWSALTHFPSSKSRPGMNSELSVWHE